MTTAQREGTAPQPGAVHGGELGRGQTATSSFRVTIALQSWDRPRLLEDVARTFAEYGCNIVEYGGHVSDQMARNWYTVEVGDVKTLRSLLSALKNLDAVFDAYRVTPGG